jgi:hypothetical protein
MKRGVRRNRSGKSPLVLLEEAVHLLRSKPFDIAVHYIGSLPFVLGFIYFITEMSTGANASKNLPNLTWMMVFLFLWMKAWHAIFAGGLLRRLEGHDPLPWRKIHYLQAFLIQAAVQPWALIVLPLAFIFMLPFPRTFAFFENVSVLGDGSHPSVVTVTKKSWQQASLWPFQNSLIIWLSSPTTLCAVVASALAISYGMTKMYPAIGASDPRISMITGLVFLGTTVVSALLLSPLAAVIALNIGVAIYNVPFLLKTFFAIETPFVTSGALIVTNSTFLAIVCGLAYLCLDPLFKAGYVLRCFYGDSLKNGQDLRAELSVEKRMSHVMSMCIAFLFVLLLSAPALAQTDQLSPAIASKTSVVPASLDSALDKVIKGPSYSWRMAREKAPPADDKGNEFLKGFFGAIFDVLKKGINYAKDGINSLVEWIGDLLGRLFSQADKIPEPKTGRLTTSSVVVIVLLAGLLALAGYLFWRNWKRRTSDPIAAVVAIPALIPDIRNDDVDATSLPDEGWMTMARDFREKGELRLALRAIYLASLASLSRLNVIVVERYKSDREYEVEVKRRDHAYPGLVAIFAQTRASFEGSWYGNHAVSMAVLDQMVKNQESILEYGQQ